MRQPIFVRMVLGKNFAMRACGAAGIRGGTKLGGNCRLDSRGVVGNDGTQQTPSWCVCGGAQVYVQHTLGRLSRRGVFIVASSGTGARSPDPAGGLLNGR